MTLIKIASNLILSTIVLLSCTTGQETLKGAYGQKFLIGAAINVNISSGRNTASARVLRQHFNAVVPENCLKSMYLQPEEGTFAFREADRYVDFGEANNLWITGHCLVWHSQAPRWLFVDENGAEVSRDVLLARLRNHITAVVSRYKGRIKGWDVVNEAIMEDGSYRQSPLYNIIGPDFIDSAFVWAHRADPAAELYYNDYNMAEKGKRDAVVALINRLKSNGIRIDAIGMQAHLHLDYPLLSELEKSIEAFAATGLKVMITELDISVLPRARENVGADVATNFEYLKELNPYAEGLPADVDSAWTQRYADMFSLLLKHSDAITRVTTWGITDGDSWLNDWPVRGRADYPLLFDRNYQAKPVVEKLIHLTKEI
ncbi:MAG: endo-1,4-beta-xylanase [Tannerella sp.]|nr:endo-1,4-beta-xylanase [Tannerella sp.]